MVEIPLKNGKTFVVDASDMDAVLNHSWHARKGPRPYVQSSIKTGERWSTVLLHRFLLRPAPGMFVDHVDGNPLNNSRANLRIATPAQNAAHRTRANRGLYIGVYRTASGKWGACISPNGRTVYLGSFDSELSAAAAYNDAAAKAFGDFAGKNDIQEACHG